MGPQNRKIDLPQNRPSQFWPQRPIFRYPQNLQNTQKWPKNDPQTVKTLYRNYCYLGTYQKPQKHPKMTPKMTPKIHPRPLQKPQNTPKMTQKHTYITPPTLMGPQNTMTHFTHFTHFWPFWAIFGPHRKTPKTPQNDPSTPKPLYPNACYLGTYSKPQKHPPKWPLDHPSTPSKTQKNLKNTLFWHPRFITPISRGPRNTIPLFYPFLTILTLCRSSRNTSKTP